MQGKDILQSTTHTPLSLSLLSALSSVVCSGNAGSQLLQLVLFPLLHSPEGFLVLLFFFFHSFCICFFIFIVFLYQHPFNLSSTSLVCDWVKTRCSSSLNSPGVLKFLNRISLVLLLPTVSGLLQWYCSGTGAETGLYAVHITAMGCILPKARVCKVGILVLYIYLPVFFKR